MSRYSLSFGHPTLGDRLLGRGLGVDLVLIVVGVALISVAAQLVVPLWPVPVTGQTFAVLAVGAALGALRGAISAILYAVGGVLGLPIFGNKASGLEIFIEQSGGYIIGFIAAAAFAGWAAQRALDRSFTQALVVAICGVGAIYLVGLPWMGIANGFGPSETLSAGFYPFALGEGIKVLLFATINAVSWTGMLKLESQEQQRSMLGGF